jgi:nucleotide-binding universal stress UspA family protein
MNTIVLATDGSPSAAAATAEAIALAQELEARLVAVAVEHIAVPAYGYYGYGDVYSELLAGEHEHVQRVLAEVAHQAEDGGVDCETVVATGSVVEEICRVARDRDAMFVVVGAHGWGVFRRAVFGSVSTGVLHEAPCPVLVVRSRSAAVEHERVHADAAVV